MKEEFIDDFEYMLDIFIKSHYKPETRTERHIYLREIRNYLIDKCKKIKEEEDYEKKFSKKTWKRIKKEAYKKAYEKNMIKKRAQ